MAPCDKLQRGKKAPGGIHEPLDVAPHQGMYCSLSNRRLTALMMYQALHRDVCVKACCRICNDDTEKFEESNSTHNKGLGVDTRDGDSKHFGAPLFQRAEYVLHQLSDTKTTTPGRILKRAERVPFSGVNTLDA